MGSRCHKAMVIHLSEQIASGGPLWALSMLFYERLWNWPKRWRAQQVHPAAAMANTYKAFKVAKAALNASGTANAYDTTFDRDSNATLLPANIHKAGLLDIHLSTAQPMQLFSVKGVSREEHAGRAAGAAPESGAQVEGAVAAICARPEEEPSSAHDHR